MDRDWLFANGGASIILNITPLNHRYDGVGRYLILRGDRYQYSRVVKGGRLKICCVCFVGSNPTAGIFGEHGKFGEYGTPC